MNNNLDSTEFPLAAALPQKCTPVEAFLKLAHLPHVIFLDSSAEHPRLGRYSFVAADPFEWFQEALPQPNSLTSLEGLWAHFSAEHRADLPPFQGGLAGLFGYGLASSLESLPGPRIVDFPMPDVALGFYDVVLAFDHVAEQAWIISQGFPETDELARRRHAKQRLKEFLSILDGPIQQSPISQGIEIPLSQLAPQFPTKHSQVTSNTSAEHYQAIINRAIEYIHAGDVFQVNVAQRLLAAATRNSVSLYLKLRDQNPAPYAGYFDLGDWQICSSSPECFLRLQRGLAETRPIKGTRGRSSSPEADLFSGDDLQLSEKDRAENVMIVDLMRNDFSRVCRPETVQVAELFNVETYAHVKHLVSAVRGQLQDKMTPFDLFRACFPGGSITGAPKIRAMEIISELEPTARGAYCGSLGYIGFNGEMNTNILIRTITSGGGWWQFPVGGGIVAQSNAEDEYAETWHKARGLLRAIQS